MSGNGTPGCRCKYPRITIAGVCTVCGKERLHVSPKVPFASTALPLADQKDAA